MVTSPARMPPQTPPASPRSQSDNTRRISARVVVWGAPEAIERGEQFSVKIGVKCSAECPPDGWAVEVCDHDGNKQATAALGEEPWPGTEALYYTQVELTAPEAEGRHAWEARAAAAGPDVPNSEGSVGFGVSVVPKPECLLTVLAIDRESQAPVEGARVVVQSYRAVTDERGVAQVRVPKGEYRVFVSRRDCFPFRVEGEVKTDVTIRAELALDPGLSDADVWS